MFFLAPIVCTVCDFSFSQQIVKNFVPASENVWTILHSIKIHENMTVMQFLSEKWEGEDNVKYVWNNLSAHFSREEENSQRDKTFHFRALSQDQILTPALFTRNSSWYFKAYCISEVCVELDFDADAAYWNFYHSCEENGWERGIFLLRSQDGIFWHNQLHLGLLAARKICSVKHTLAVDNFVKEKVPGKGRDVHLDLVEEKTIFGMRWGFNEFTLTF